MRKKWGKKRGLKTLTFPTIEGGRKKVTLDESNYDNSYYLPKKKKKKINNFSIYLKKMKSAETEQELSI